MKKVSIGPCPVCYKNIWKYWPRIRISKTGISISFHKKPYALTEEGEHFWILETTGARMMVAICKECRSNLTDDIVREIHANIIYTKIKALEKLKDESRKIRLFNHLRTIEVWQWANTEGEIVQILNKIKNG